MDEFVSTNTMDDSNVTSAIDNDDFQQQTYFNLQCDYYDPNYPKEHKWLGLMHVVFCTWPLHSLQAKGIVA